MHYLVYTNVLLAVCKSFSLAGSDMGLKFVSVSQELGLSLATPEGKGN